MASNDQYQQQQEYNVSMADIETKATEMEHCLRVILENVTKLNSLGREVKAHQDLHRAHWKHFNATKINDIFERSKSIDQHLFELKKL